MRTPRALGLLLAMLSVVGCGTTGVVRVADPAVSLLRLGAPTGAAGRDSELRIDLRIGNPNARELLFAGVRFDLELDGEGLARVVSEQTISIRPEGGLFLSVLARPMVRDWQSRIQRIQGRPSPYRLLGELRMVEPVHRVIPVALTGSLPRTAPPLSETGSQAASRSSISSRPGPAGRSSRSARRE